MNSIIRSFSLAVKMIFNDPVNIVLAIIPAFMALAIYLLSISAIYGHFDQLVSLFRGYVPTADQATLWAGILTAILIVFIFFLMSWTFVVLVGIVSAPFNSLLSARIEEKLVERKIMDEDQKHALVKIKGSFGRTMKNEFKKVLFLILMTGLIFFLNLFPFLYPVALFLIAILFSVQFLDYSWSRHDLSFARCLKDVTGNLIPYFLSGAIFLPLLAIPLVNAFIPSLATSYYTILWLDRQKKI